MDLTIHPARRLEGTLRPPPSKSYTHRALMAAALAEGTSRIENGLRSDDTEATLRACRAFGASMEGTWDRLRVGGFGSEPRCPRRLVNAGESGTTLRLLLPWPGLVEGPVTLDGTGSLRSRPNGYILPALAQMGLRIRGAGPDHRVPLRAEGRGHLAGADLTLPGTVYSSQFLSGLLLAAPRARGETRIRIAGRLVSRPYIGITLDILRRASVTVAGGRGLRPRGVAGRDSPSTGPPPTPGGKPRPPPPGGLEFRIPGDQTYRPFRFRVGGDWSAAANWLVAGCLVESDLRLRGLVADAQGDRVVLRFLGAMGAEFRVGRDSVRVRGPFRLRGRSLDLGDHPDLVPPLAVAAGFASGTTLLRNIGHLRLKESDRLGGLAAKLQALGIRARASRESLKIEGGRSRPRGGTVSSGGDHRVAMAAAVAGLRAGPVRILGAESVSKSYPGFAAHLRTVAGERTLFSCR